MEKSLNISNLTLGTCYYPEHWPETLWQEDLQRMMKAGIQVIRIAEFAWNKFEPTEGNYDFTFFDRFLDLVETTEMKVIFCTPSATPPAWLTEKYPEVLNAFRDGTLIRHGLRRHYNYNSPVYQEKVAALVSKMAEHYGTRSCIIGWQIDNEFNCESTEFYSDADHLAFRSYVQKKYQTLDALNDAWGTVFWNQTYTDWSQIYLPRETANGVVNPHQSLDAKQFWSASARAFCKLQSDILRKLLPENNFITTNGFFGHLDSHAMTQESLDFLTYDSYPNFAYGLDFQSQNPMKDRAWSWNLCHTRSISPIYGIMEQQSGPNGAYGSGRGAASPKPGQLRLWTMQSIAHGADYISYFRWRTSWIGTEIYWHGILNYDNQDNRRLAEVTQVAEDLKKINGIVGKKYKADVAIAFDYLNDWDSESDGWHGPVGRKGQDSWFNTLQSAHIPCDFLYFSDDIELTSLMKYRMIVYPDAAIITEKVSSLLHEYVENGGTLILGPRTGYKDEYGRCPMMKTPGLLADLAGGTVEDFTFISKYDAIPSISLQGRSAEAPLFNEILTPDNAEVIGTYSGAWYEGKPAVLKNRYGKGLCWTFGSAFSEDTVLILLSLLGISSPIKGWVDVPAKVEIAVRGNYLFLLNYQNEEVPIRFLRSMKDYLSGQKLSGEQKMPPFGVFVLEI